jgi:hypothetical protein
MLNLLDSERMLRRKLLLFKINLERFFVFSKSIASNLDKSEQNIYTKGVI